MSAKAPRGRKRKAGEGKRLTRSQIALRSGINRETVSQYLARDGAPKPDGDMRYDYDSALAFIKANAPKVGQQSPEMAQMREALLRIQLEKEQIELAVQRGRYVDKTKIVPAIAGFNTQLTDDLRMKFESELPPKYEGKNRVERQQMNADAIDWVLRRLKAGQRPLTSGVEMPTANVIGEGMDKV